ncbi:hypothetical protein E4J66_12225 [Actinomyces viscosus]|uniref:Nitroreductase family n=1 Tax=Actinomyces viscosus TaxID=1656 RepID=A0A448PMU4_ACTVI|nr:hypothetical protein [Actinomyces viscosus]TFH51398.1 hypothetical protein E4J66_12225 [Actinomyces viscosus]VEI17390.1 Uncharacterised protein [Actinomyces viscosus]
MRTDFETLRELISGFSDGSDSRPGEPTSDGLAARRPRPPLGCQVPDALRPGPQAAYPYDLHQTFERRSSSTSYGTEPLEAEALMAMVRDALADDARTWGQDAVDCPLEPFVLLLRPRGASPGIYRVRLDGVDLVRPLPEAGVIEGMTVQKEFARAGAIVSVAANLDQADTWGGAAGYRFTMSRSAALIYSVHLRAVARGLVGTVFAGFATSAVRHLLDSDGVSRHQMFAVTVAGPVTSPAADPADAPGVSPASG